MPRENALQKAKRELAAAREMIKAQAEHIEEIAASRSSMAEQLKSAVMDAEARSASLDSEARALSDCVKAIDAMQERERMASAVRGDVSYNVNAMATNLPNHPRWGPASIPASDTAIGRILLSLAARYGVRIQETPLPEYDHKADLADRLRYLTGAFEDLRREIVERS